MDGIDGVDGVMNWRIEVSDGDREYPRIVYMLVQRMTEHQAWREADWLRRSLFGSTGRVLSIEPWEDCGR